VTGDLIFPPFRIDFGTERLWRDDQAIALRPKTWGVLRYLAERPGKLVSKTELFDAVWRNTAVEEKGLNVSIAELRRLLGDDARNPRFIETVHRRGFRFIASVGARAPDAATDASPDPRASIPLFIGRSGELAVLQEAIDAAAGGHGQVVFVCGEAGIGKTRLVEEAIGYAGRAGVHIYIGHSVQAESAPPYWPWVEILRAWAGTFEDAALRRVAGPGVAELGRLLPGLHGRLPDIEPAPTDDPESARIRLLDAVATFVTRAADACPQLLVFEDLHWADEPSLLLLQFLARDIAHSRVAIVATCREPDGAAPLLAGQVMARLAQSGLQRTIRLAGFDARETGSLARGLLGAAMPDTILHDLVQTSEGNPFFIEQILQHLRELDLIDPERGQWRSRLLDGVPLPASVIEIFERRVRRLSPSCQERLNLAAVIGTDFDETLLQLASGAEIDEVLADLDEALQAGVIRAAGEGRGGYGFAHALMCQALYQRQSIAARRRWHRRVGEVLERLPGGKVEDHLSELAHHFFEAGTAGDPQRAITYARQAAEQAQALYAYDSAARHLEHAACLLDESRPPGWEPLLCEISLGQAEALDRAGDGARARATFEQAAARARSLSLPRLLARAALGLATRWVYDDPGVLQLLEEAAQRIGEADPALRARVLARLAQVLYFTPGTAARRVHLCDEAAALARHGGDPALLGEVLVDQLEALFHDSNIDEQCNTAASLLALAPSADDPRVHLTARAWSVVLSMRRGRLRAADAELVHFAQLAEDLKLPRFRWYALYFGATLALARGRVTDAERLILEASAIGGRVSAEGAAVVAWAQLFGLRREQGRLPVFADLEPTVQLSALPATRTGRTFAGVGSWLLPLFCSEQGHAQEARAAFDAAMAGGLDQLPQENALNTRITALASLAVTCAFLDDRASAPELYEYLRPYAAQWNVLGWGVACHTAVTQLLGLLAGVMRQWDLAVHYFDTAMHDHEREGAVTAQVRTLHNYSRMLAERHRRGDRALARTLISRGRALAAEHGLTHLGDQLTRLAAATQMS